MADLYDLGDKPPLGEVPKRMHAFAVRQNRFGQPRDAWKREVLPTPTIGQTAISGNRLTCIASAPTLTGEILMKQTSKGVPCFLNNQQNVLEKTPSRG